MQSWQTDYCKALTINWENWGHKRHFLFVAQKTLFAQLSSGTDLKKNKAAQDAQANSVE